MSNIERYEREQHFRKRLDTKGRKVNLFDHMVTAVLLVLIFAMLRVVMLARGMAFFYLPFFDNAIYQVLSWSQDFFNNSGLWK